MKAIRTILAYIRKADAMFNLIQHGDKIVIGLSGGKDSVALTYCLNLYKKFSHTKFSIQPVMLNLGFPNFDPSKMIAFCRSIGLELIVSDNSEVYKILEIQKEKQDTKHLPCSICSRMKKAAINKIAKEIGYNKVAFAHHMDDALETLFMNEINGGRISTFSPKMHLEKADIEFIRPLILAHEKEITALIKEENLPTLDSHCPADKFTNRENMKEFLNSLYKQYPIAKESFSRMLFNYQNEDTWGKELNYQINQKGLFLKPVITSNDTLEMINIRYIVFVEEQKIPYKNELVIKEENNCHNFLIYLKDKVIGTIRYRKTDEGYKIERFAIIKKYRNKGYGTLSFNYLVNMIAAENNPCLIYVNSQNKVIHFYEKCGFEKTGSYFKEAKIKHIRMQKKF